MGNARVLVVEDEPTIRSSVAAALREDGHDVEELASGEHLERTLAAYRPSVVVLDWMLPGRDGPALARVMRGSRRPRRHHADRPRGRRRPAPGLRRGRRRLRAEAVRHGRAGRSRCARCCTVLGPIPATLQIGDLVVDEAGGQRRRAATSPLPLTATEFRLLAYLAANRGRVVSSTQILTQVWGYEDYSDNLVQATHEHPAPEDGGARPAPRPHGARAGLRPADRPVSDATRALAAHPFPPPAGDRSSCWSCSPSCSSLLGVTTQRRPRQPAGGPAGAAARPSGPISGSPSAASSTPPTSPNGWRATGSRCSC